MKIPKHVTPTGELVRQYRLLVDPDGRVHRQYGDNTYGNKLPRGCRWADPELDASNPEVQAATKIIAAQHDPRLRANRRAHTPPPSSRTIVRRKRGA